MPATGLLTPNSTFIDDDGNPAAGWFLYTYEAGTSTPAPTYTDSDLLVPNQNPIELDAAGGAIIYVDPDVGALKIVATDADGVPQWEQDNIFPAAVAP